jgi:predicted phosphodiesterase
MKIAVLADIHANYRALETIIDDVERWKPDVVLVAGDIVNRGPRSFCCLELVEKKRKKEGWQVIRGNHEDYVISRDEPDAPQSGPLYELFQPVCFTYAQLHGDVSAISALPEQLSLDFGDAGEVRMLHASMHSNRDGIYPETTDNELKNMIKPAPAVFITGHTHRALVRKVNGALVVNAGSVGLPFDADTRAGYAQVIWTGEQWLGEIIRLEYDMVAAERDYYGFGFIQEGGPLARLVLLEMKSAMSQLYPWTERYNLPIQAGQITVEEATREFLENPITQPYW